MNLLSLESLQKNICFTRYLNRKTKLKQNTENKKNYSSGFVPLVGEDEFWTSALSSGCGKSGHGWCTRYEANVQPAQVSWLSGHPNAALGACVHANVRNASGENATTQIGSSNCLENMRFVCEVRQRGTTGHSLTVECMAIWDITEGWFYSKENLSGEFRQSLLIDYSKAFAYCLRFYIFKKYFDFFPLAMLKKGSIKNNIAEFK